MERPLIGWHRRERSGTNKRIAIRGPSQARQWKAQRGAVTIGWRRELAQQSKLSRVADSHVSGGHLAAWRPPLSLATPPWRRLPRLSPRCRARGCPTRRPPEGGFWRPPTVGRHLTWRGPVALRSAEVALPHIRRCGVAHARVGSAGGGQVDECRCWSIGLRGTAVSITFLLFLVQLPLARGRCPRPASLSSHHVKMDRRWFRLLESEGQTGF